ncbi:hypothetical protein PYCCODRAFT_1434391 [Trametes coccinea BRFM310]|uniref:Uncharacterized protein n=1 Tax=Trametes coccinea (strain BRFM310) TaxID=1353009 RepID=A0A1Y2IQV4_TRAC3|nr:hypothetical protein PYCCODRAFT_1434391 [Trametes coccinea BRFM310]
MHVQYLYSESYYTHPTLIRKTATNRALTRLSSSRVLLVHLRPPPQHRAIHVLVVVLATAGRGERSIRVRRVKLLFRSRPW